MLLLAAIATLCLYAEAALQKLEAESDPQAAQLWEDETRAMGWRWLARKRHAQARRKSKLGQRRGLNDNHR